MRKPLLFVALLLLACGTPDRPTGPREMPRVALERRTSKLSINPAVPTLRVGETVTLTAMSGQRVSTQSLLLWGCVEYGCPSIIEFTSIAQGPTVQVTGKSPGVATVYVAYGERGWGYATVTVQ